MTRLSSSEFYTSPLSRFCHEQLPGDFHFLDGDEIILRYSAQPVTYSRETRVLRLFESKSLGEEIRRSQRDVLPILAEAIKLAVESGVLAKGSGVFIIEGEEPYERGADLSQVLPDGKSRAVGLQTIGPRRLNRDELETFVRCRNLAPRTAA